MKSDGQLLALDYRALQAAEFTLGDLADRCADVRQVDVQKIKTTIAKEKAHGCAFFSADLTSCVFCAILI